jgi:hypothetical protein
MTHSFSILDDPHKERCSICAFYSAAFVWSYCDQLHRHVCRSCASFIITERAEPVGLGTLDALRWIEENHDSLTAQLFVRWPAGMLAITERRHVEAFPMGEFQLIQKEDWLRRSLLDVAPSGS